MMLLMTCTVYSCGVVWCVFQSVTAVESTDDHNSYWRVRSKIGSNCVRGWAMCVVHCDCHLAIRISSAVCLRDTNNSV